MAETIRFEEELTINCVSEMIDTLRNSLRKSSEVVVDIEDVKKVDVAAVQVLLAAHRECEKEGCRIIVKRSDAVTDMMSLIGIQL